MTSALYRGSLVHTRRDHLHRTFRYPVFMAAIDLAEIERLDRDLRLFSLDRPNLFSLYGKDYSVSIFGPHSNLSTSKPSTPSPHSSTPSSTTSPHSQPSTRATSTTLVTNLRFAGYAFNPVSFFLRYAGDDLVSVLAEVNNTYGGRHVYELDDSNRIHANSEHARLGTGRIGFRTTREFFVSPFLHGPRVYEWWFPATRDPEQLAITMHVDTPAGDRIFTATVAGERRAMTDRGLLAAALRYPINTAQVIGLIHLEAMKLRFLYNEPYRRPGPDHRPLDT